jgi:transposase-like protein
MDSLCKTECIECNSTKLDIIEVDEYNEILRFKCKDCGDTFTKPTDNLCN